MHIAYKSWNGHTFLWSFKYLYIPLIYSSLYLFCFVYLRTHSNKVYYKKVNWTANILYASSKNVSQSFIFNPFKSDVLVGVE